MTFESITTAITNLTSVMDTVLTEISGQPMLMVLLAVPVVGAGCAVFRKLVRTAK